MNSDPSVLPRLLGHFQNLNVTPRLVGADFGASARMQLHIDICGRSQERLSLTTSKISQCPSVLNPYWHYL